ncbi:hypothetical protein L1887_15014 [Cichorium endivia]|nr:hypothetical protein L1887_15014 [Cichorium endivia]
MKYSHRYPKSHENGDRFPLKRNHHGRSFLLCSVNCYPFFHSSNLSNETPKWVYLQKPHHNFGLHQNQEYQKESWSLQKRTH